MEPVRKPLTDPVWAGVTATAAITGLGRKRILEKIADGTIEAVMPGTGKWLVHQASALAYVASLPSNREAVSATRRRLDRAKSAQPDATP